MNRLIKGSLWLLGICSVIGVMFWLSQPKVTEAACGASTSSCKTCHEVQGQDPVSKKGDWHVQHAFGDFCTACHLGVGTESDKTKAHAGMILNPLKQPDQTCASCHPSDTAARVAKYGGSAGSVGSGSSSGAGQSAGTNSASAAPSAAAGQVPSVPSVSATQTPAAANPNYDLIDFNKDLQNSFPWLSFIFIVLDILAFLALLVMLWRWKKGVWLWSYIHRRKGHGGSLERLSPELQAVLQNLQEGDFETVLAVETLLARGDNGRALLKTVVSLPQTVLDQLQSLSEEQVDLLFQVGRLMREQKGGMSNAN